MKKLLMFEFHNLFHKKSLYVCAAVMIALLVLVEVTSWVIMQDYGISYMICVPETMVYSLYDADVVLFAGIFISMYVCMDFKYGTYKNVYARGFSKGSIYFAKFVAVFASMLIIYLAAMLTELVCSWILFGFSEYVDANYALIFVTQIFFVLANAALVYAIGMSTQKTSITVVFALLTSSMVDVVLSLIDGLLDMESFLLSDYWLESIEYDITSLYTDNGRLVLCLVLSILYAALFMEIGFAVYRRREH